MHITAPLCLHRELSSRQIKTSVAGVLMDTHTHTHKHTHKDTHTQIPGSTMGITADDNKTLWSTRHCSSLNMVCVEIKAGWMVNIEPKEEQGWTHTSQRKLASMLETNSLPLWHLENKHPNVINDTLSHTHIHRHKAFICLGVRQLLRHLSKVHLLVLSVNVKRTHTQKDTEETEETEEMYVCIHTHAHMHTHTCGELQAVKPREERARLSVTHTGRISLKSLRHLH